MKSIKNPTQKTSPSLLNDKNGGPFNKMKDNAEKLAEQKKEMNLAEQSSSLSGMEVAKATLSLAIMLLWFKYCYDYTMLQSKLHAAATQDAGIVQNAKDNKVCTFRKIGRRTMRECKYPQIKINTLSIDGQIVNVENGGKVKIGSDEYVVKNIEKDGIIIESKNKIYVFKSDTSLTIDGVKVNYLGVSTEEMNDAYIDKGDEK